MSYLGDIGHVRGRGTRREGIHSVEWKIPDFLSLGAGDGDWYQSTTFDTLDREWYLEIYPEGINSSLSGSVDVFLYRLSGYPHETLNVRLSIETEEGEENEREMRKEISDDDGVCAWIAFCERYELEELEERWMEGGSLTLSLRMERVLPTQDASIQTDVMFEEAKAPPVKSNFCHQCNVSPDDVELSAEKQGIQEVVEDIEKLLVNGNKSDITVQVKETEFRLHSNILSARSPVLSAMLEHDMAEKASNKICIDDCEPDVFEKYLRYLYTGAFQLPSSKTVFGLYGIADKYLADRLKLLCLKHIRNTLCVQTFCDTVKLALIYRENDLLQLAIDFATQNFQSIVTTIEWQNFICENPMSANEILVKCFGPRR